MNKHHIPKFLSRHQLKLGASDNASVCFPGSATGNPDGVNYASGERKMGAVETTG